jgi:polar amino acid transport system substrate-binding protein
MRADPLGQGGARVLGAQRVPASGVSGGGAIPADIAAMTRKDNGLVGALNAALDTVIANGKYAEVLDRWKLSSETLDKSEINPPGLPRKPA